MSYLLLSCLVLSHLVLVSSGVGPRTGVRGEAVPAGADAPGGAQRLRPVGVLFSRRTTHLFRVQGPLGDCLGRQGHEAGKGVRVEGATWTQDRGQGGELRVKLGWDLVLVWVAAIAVRLDDPVGRRGATECTLPGGRVGDNSSCGESSLRRRRLGSIWGSDR